MYCQLCTTTAYNLKDSTVLPEEYASKAKEYGYSGIGIGDNNLYAFPSFADACEKEGIKPIFGYHLKINGSKTFPFDAYLYVLNEQGYLNLCALLADKQESYPLTTLGIHKTGLALVLETTPDYFSSPFLSAISPDLLSFKKTFGKNFYIGISVYSPLDQEEVSSLYDYCKDFDYQTIAFPKCLYVKKKDAYKTNLLQVALAKEKADNLETEGPYFLLSPKTMESLYRKEDLLMTECLADKVDFTFFKKRGALITLENEDEVLKEKAETGLKEKLNVASLPEEYARRLEYELGVIKEMKFSSYFLIVDDYVRFAKTSQIKVGPGRGSAGGSLVAYGLDITNVDPLRFDLTFERFLNPHRKTMPDIDIDFENTRRDEIVTYLKNRYGETRVSDIVTFVKLKPKSCLNLIGPALGFDEAKLKRLTSAISRSNDNFKKAIESNSEEETEEEDSAEASSFNALMNEDDNDLLTLYKDPYYKEICDLANTLCGVPINTSIHAAGIILSDQDISLTCPRKGGHMGTVLFEYPYMERMGFLKVDLLALSNLTFIKDIEARIISNHKPLPDIFHDLNNPKVYDILNQGDLVEIFQLSTSWGMKNTIKAIQPTNFNDIAACLALFRPGPEKNIPHYAARKHSQEEVIYPDEKLKPILEETYGIFVYQEQIIKALTAIADFSLSEADLFRRAISKKDEKKMLSYKEKFLQGCQHNGMSKEKAEVIFRDIQEFASYGFNKAHAVGYSYVAYTLLYYKALYPEEFYLTALENNSFSSPKANDLLKELNHRHYKVKNPNINLSDSLHYHLQDSTIYLPLHAVNNVNGALLDNIVREREHGPFTSFYNFALRMSEQISPNDVKSITNLIDSGAFDCFSKTRLGMKNFLEQYLEAAHFSLPEDSVVPLSDEGEDIGEMLYLEKMAIGKVLSCHFYQIFSKYRYQTLLVTDTSYLEKSNEVTLESESRSYRIRLTKKYDLSKYDFVLIPGLLSLKKETLSVKELIPCKRKIVKHG